jgi:hypothetical protein
MVKINCTGGTKSKEVLHRDKEEGSIIHTSKPRKTIWTGHVWRNNCLLKHTKKRQKGREDEKKT